MNKIRALREDEIEVRVAKVTENGCQLLLYKDARCDKRILDEVYGANNWQNSYAEIKGNLYCSIQIWDPDKKQWISKQDCGIESYADPQKGEASDAFKRAAFNLGIGRELYTRLFIWLNLPTRQAGQKYELVNKYMRFSVSHIKTNNEREIIEEITIADEKGNIVYTYPPSTRQKPATVAPVFAKAEPIQNKQAQDDEIISDAELETVKAAVRARYGSLSQGLPALSAVYTKLGIPGSSEITKNKLQAVLEEIEKS